MNNLSGEICTHVTVVYLFTGSRLPHVEIRHLKTLWEKNILVMNSKF